MDAPKLPSVLVYHAKVNARRGDRVLSVEVDWHEWVPEAMTILRELGRAYGVGTVGGVIERYVSENPGKILISQEAKRFYLRGDQDLMGWDDKL